MTAYIVVVNHDGYQHSYAFDSETERDIFFDVANDLLPGYYDIEQDAVDILGSADEARSKLLEDTGVAS